MVPYGFYLLAIGVVDGVECAAEMQPCKTALFSDKYGFTHLVLPGKSAKWLTVKVVVDDKLARSVAQLLGYSLLLDHVRADLEREASLVKDAPWAPAKKTAGPPHPMAPPVGSPPKAPPPGCFLEGPIRRPLEAPAHAASAATSTAPLLTMPDEPWV